MFSKMNADKFVKCMLEKNYFIPHFPSLGWQNFLYVAKELLHTSFSKSGMAKFPETLHTALNTKMNIF